MNTKTLVLFLTFTLALFISCKEKSGVNLRIKKDDFSLLKDSGEITVITLSGSTSYFIYKGEPMGYEYELIRDFAESNNLKLKIKVAENVTRLPDMLLAGEGDVIAYNIPITNELKKKILYCGRETITRQVLVQRSTKKDTILNDVTQLIGKSVWVKHGTKYYDRLFNLNEELGGGVIIKDIEKDTVTTEDLIGMVSDGTIPYTVSDDVSAKLNKTYYSNINIDLVLSHPQRSSWAVRNTSPALANALNRWFEKNVDAPKYKSIIKRYFEMSKSIEETEDMPLPVITKGKISPYDQIFQKYAPTIHWDWELIASIAYQESRFDTTGVSWAGAVGLMGLMPKTAEAFGITSEERTNPEKSVMASVLYIKRVGQSFTSIPAKEEKIKFILAAYNAGIGHVFDARALARKYGKDPDIWDGNVEEYVRLKSNPEYYNDSVCKNGYLRGRETVEYVTQVMRRYEYYKSRLDKK